MAALTALGLLLAGCSESEQAERIDPAPMAGVEDAAPKPVARCPDHDPRRQALFGDLHVHTSFSFDAAANSTGGTPTDANRFARGESIPFFPIGADGKPTGSVKIDRPLDFLAVTDHGEFLGERALCRTPGSPAYDTSLCQQSRANEREGMMLLATVITTETPERIAEICGADGAQCLESARSPWGVIQETANRFDTPCEFTSFVAYEYTGTPGTSNYHRNVIFRNSEVPELPVSYIEAPIDSKLWAGLDASCSGSCDYLTIPHNTNLANGRMAPYRKLDPTVENKRAYAEKRLQREPIMEIFQHKGASECINGLTSVLGPPDELCDVEAVRRMGENKAYVTRVLKDGQLTTGTAYEVTRECEPGERGSSGMLGAGCVDATDFQRSALVVGLREEIETGVNPIKLGVIAATDTHSATPGAVLESDWPGAVTGESNPAGRLEKGLLTSGIDGNPGGLAGVWATENTRDAIFDAMQRREVFGTSGPRILPRFFAGWELSDDLCDRADMVEAAYAAGVPMGGDLTPGTGRPRFLLSAQRDPDGLPLAALQLVKGWVAADGSLHTEVMQAASSDAGSSTLCAVYEDERFDPAQSAYYYMRVVEPPTPRWHGFDCERLPEAERPPVCTDGSYPATVQEMAWTSPIWYRGAR